MIAVISHDPAGGVRLAAPTRDDLAWLTSWLPLHPHALESIRKNARVIATGPKSILYSISRAASSPSSTWRRS